MEKYAGIILGAGKGTRMNEGAASPIPKVMYEMNGKPIIWHDVRLLERAGVNLIAVVVGYRKELIIKYLGNDYLYPEQKEQLGTGHAVMMAKDLLEGKATNVIIFYGDNPLYKTESVKKLIKNYESEKSTIALLTVKLENPSYWAFGRIIRDASGDIIDIREQKDCSEEQLKIKETNPGFYIIDAAWLWQNIGKIKNNNAKQEYYLTDIVKIAAKQNKKIIGVSLSEEYEAIGINTPEQLKQAENILKSR